MVTGAFFEPKALWGSTSVRPAADCGAGAGEASFATTTGAGMIGVSVGAGALAVSDGVCTNVGADVDAGSRVLWKEGRNRANRLSKPTLRIPAKMRRRFTRSSEIIRAICPCGPRNRILPRNSEKVRVVAVQGSSKQQATCRHRGSLDLVTDCTGSVVRWPLQLGEDFHALGFCVRNGSKLMKTNVLFILSENLTNIHSTCILRFELGLGREN